jgi:hypothetical protein
MSLPNVGLFNSTHDDHDSADSATSASAPGHLPAQVQQIQPPTHGENFITLANMLADPATVSPGSASVPTTASSTSS